MLLRPEQVFGLLSGGPQFQTLDFDDFVNGGENSSGAALVINTHTFGKLSWRAATALGGTVTMVATDQDANTHGVVELGTTGNAASAAGFARFPSGLPQRVIGAGFRWRMTARVRNIPTLSDGTNRNVFRWGLLNSPAVDPTDGFYAEYSDNINTGKWQAVAMKASTPTAIASAVTVAINTPYVLELGGDTVNAYFKVNGVQIGTTGYANMPTNAVGEGVSWLAKLGTAARVSRLDWHYSNFAWGAGR